MASIWDYISPTGEGSQARSKWLRDNVDQPISEAARYYLGAGTGVPSLLDLAADGTPSAGLGRASQASQKLFSPDQSILNRINSVGNLLSETAGVGAGLLGVNQTARAVGPAVEDATRAFGRNVAERLNQRGPMPTLGSNGGNMFDDKTSGILAYHGSPYSFDKFDASKIGTGEGAQAYGHGLYFAENEGVARGYRDALSRQVTLDGKPMLSHPSDGPVGQAENSIARAVSNGEDPASAISREAKEWRDAAQAYRDAGVGQTSDVARSAEQTARSFEDVANAIEAQDPNRFIKNTGSMYEVNINANADDFLDLDKAINEQPLLIQDLIKNRKNPETELSKIYDKKMAKDGTGEDIYDYLYGGYDDPINASNLLKNSGVKGASYLDRNSRSVGAGTRNYVVFDDRLVSIVRKYGIAGAATMLGVSQADVSEAMGQGNKQQGLLSK